MNKTNRGCTRVVQPGVNFLNLSLRTDHDKVLVTTNNGDLWLCGWKRKIEVHCITQFIAVVVEEHIWLLASCLPLNSFATTKNRSVDGDASKEASPTTTTSPARAPLPALAGEVAVMGDGTVMPP